jgi:hypothetical protein
LPCRASALHLAGTAEIALIHWSQRDMRTISRRLAVSRGRAALMWTLGLFAAGQLALGAWLHRAHPEMGDPTWAFRLARLRDRLAEAPGRSLVVLLGSSRVANGISPADLGDWDGPRPVVFNFATLGGGPIRELLTLRRLLAHGVRPDWLVVEVFPPFWMDKGLYEEQNAIAASDAHLSDLPALQRLYGWGWVACTRVVEANLLPIVHCRTKVLFAYAPPLVPRSTESELTWGRTHWSSLDAWGWLPVAWQRVAPGQMPAHLAEARKLTQPILDKLEVTENSDWSIRELLRECREHGIRIALLYMPEHSALRSWYPPRTRALVHGYLSGLCREYGVQVIDARDWLDDDCFQDFSHLHIGGARTFSARLGKEALRPLLKCAPLPPYAALRLDGGSSSSDGSTASPEPLPQGP